MVDDQIGINMQYASSFSNPQNIFITKAETSNYFKMAGGLRGIGYVESENDAIGFLEGNSNGRLYVYTSSGYNYGLINRNHNENSVNLFMQDTKDWFQVEASGYLKLRDSLSNDNFCIKVRGGQHDGNSDPAGCGIGVQLGYDGRLRAVKERQHPDDISFGEWQGGIGDIEGRWIGYKLVVYNVNSNQNVKIELYLDILADNVWEKYFEIVDNGFGRMGRGPGDIINYGGPVITLEYANAADPYGMVFKNLSFREIDPTRKGGSNPASSTASILGEENALILNLGGVGDMTKRSGTSVATVNLFGVENRYATGTDIIGDSRAKIAPGEETPPVE